MNVLSRLWRAVAGLAESVEALAGTVGEANGRLRQQLALDSAEALPAPRRAAKKAPAGGRAGRSDTAAAAAKRAGPNCWPAGRRWD